MYAPVSGPQEGLDDAEIVDTVLLDDEELVIRDAVAILTTARASGGGTPSREYMDSVLAEVLQLFARVEAAPELPPIIAGIGNLYENGYDAAAEHMEMAHWGLPHRVRPAQ